MGQPVRGIEVNARGQRRDEHPTVITEIALEFVVHGAGDDRRLTFARFTGVKRA